MNIHTIAKDILDMAAPTGALDDDEASMLFNRAVALASAVLPADEFGTVEFEFEGGESISVRIDGEDAHIHVDDAGGRPPTWICAPLPEMRAALLQMLWAMEHLKEEIE